MSKVFVKKGNALYMRLAIVKEGKLAMDVQGLELSPEDWQSLLNTAMLPEEGLITTAELADAFGVSMSTIANWAERGMPHVNVAEENSSRRCRRFDIMQCRAWLAQNKQCNPQTETKNDELPVQDPE